MLVADARSLLKKLNPTCTRALEQGASACVSGRHYEVTVEHVLLALIDDRDSDVVAVLAHYNVDPTTARSALQRVVGELRSGNAGKPVFSPLLLEWFQDAWIYASTELGETAVRSGALLVRTLLAPSRYVPSDLSFFDAIPREELRKSVATIASGSPEAARMAASAASSTGGGEGPKGGGATGLGAPDGPLAKFCTDLTARAKKGELDPVLGREGEIRQVVDILVRRRKNNPIIIGEPGVGKTALVEGLALRIAEGSVPDQLKDVSVLVLDLSALQAGAGVKGEFENRLKGVLNEVKASTKPIVLFIDEAHTLIGAGGAQGTGDAANLLKPALARGELRTIAATTFAEYKKYFEKDAALERRFQPVKVEEPSVDDAILMLRGVVKKFEESHGILIPDEAVRAAAVLSNRYISGRQLPDKAVDLLDTAAARVKVMRAAPPAELEDQRAQLAASDRHIAASERDRTAGFPFDQEIHDGAVTKREVTRERVAALEARLAHQRGIIEVIDGLRAHVAKGDETKRVELRDALEKLRAIPAADRLVSADVDEALVASVVGDWTGIPVGKMVQDDLASILKMEDKLRERVRGQDGGLHLIARELRAARAGIKPVTAPLGVFLVVGPSGVGKTETALALADLLFGGERFIVTINMSEFQERHTVARLIGAPAGYVGYGEGGALTEAVRHRPYSVVLLDEVEKADKDVMNVFYQVFDKGMLSDGEGRVIDFKNTVVILTSNLATDLITNAAPPDADVPDIADLTELVKPVLTAHFKPALLARMTVVPFVPIRQDALIGIVKMKLGGVVKRAKESHGITLAVDDAVYAAIADRCREVQSGARNIDHILRGSIMPMVSTQILEQMAAGKEIERMRLSMGPGAEITCAIEA
jgi:type VI secretion system protein VasG